MPPGFAPWLSFASLLVADPPGARLQPALGRPLFLQSWPQNGLGSSYSLCAGGKCLELSGLRPLSNWSVYHFSTSLSLRQPRDAKLFFLPPGVLPILRLLSACSVLFLRFLSFYLNPAAPFETRSLHCTCLPLPSPWYVFPRFAGLRKSTPLTNAGQPQHTQRLLARPHWQLSEEETRYRHFYFERERQDARP